MNRPVWQIYSDRSVHVNCGLAYGMAGADLPAERRSLADVTV
jgi:hypothetical protein